MSLARATAQELSASPDVLTDLAEVRAAKSAAAFFIDLTPAEQPQGPTICCNN